MQDKPLYRSKTFWTGLAGLVTSAAGYFTGELTLGPALQTAVTCLLGIFFRDALRVDK